MRSILTILAFMMTSPTVCQPQDLGIGVVDSILRKREADKNVLYASYELRNRFSCTYIGFAKGAIDGEIESKLLKTRPDILSKLKFDYSVTLSWGDKVYYLPLQGTQQNNHKVILANKGEAVNVKLSYLDVPVSNTVRRLVFVSAFSIVR